MKEQIRRRADRGHLAEPSLAGLRNLVSYARGARSGEAPRPMHTVNNVTGQAVTAQRPLIQCQAAAQ